MEFKTHEEFFKNVGEHHLHPTSYGEGYFSPSIEEMYKHFKARLMKELHEDHHGVNLVTEIERGNSAEYWPITADDVRGFVGSDYCSLKYGRDDQTPDDNDVYTMSAHDLASAIRNWRADVLGHDC